MNLSYMGSDQETLMIETKNKTLEITAFGDQGLLVEAEDNNDRHSVTISIDFKTAVALQNWLTSKLNLSPLDEKMENELRRFSAHLAAIRSDKPTIPAMQTFIQEFPELADYIGLLADQMILKIEGAE